MCFWCGAKINSVKSFSALSQTHNTGIMSRMLRTRGFLWGVLALCALIIFYFVQVVVLLFNPLVYTPLLTTVYSSVLFLKSPVIWGDKGGIPNHSGMSLSSPPNPPLHNPGHLCLSGWGGARCQEIQGIRPSGKICTSNVSIPQS